MAFQVHETGFGSSGAELLIHIRVGAGEGHVHHAAVFRLNGIVIEVLTVQVIIQDLGLGVVDLGHLFQAANLVLQVIHHQTGHVDAPARRGVVHAVLIQQGSVVHHGGDLFCRDVFCALAQQVVPDDGNGHTGGGNVLLHTKVDAAVLAYIGRLTENHGAHVSYQGDAVHLRHIFISSAKNGVVLADVDVAGVWVIRNGLDIRNIGEVLILAGSSDAGCAELSGFFGSLFAEVAGHQIIRRASGHKVQGHHGELLGCAALEETDLVVVGYIQHLADTGLSVLDDLIEPLAAVAHLHHAHTAAMVVQQVGLSFLQNGNRQHGRTGAEIIHTIHKRLPPKFILTPKLKAARCALLC